jgi:ribonuclease E
VGHLSKFGLLELSRQRLRPTAEVSAYLECPTCHGQGHIKRVDTLGLSLLRQISTQVAQNPIQEVRGAVPLEVATFLLNNKRKEILDLEEHFNLKITLTPKVGLGPEDIQLEYLKREAPEAKAALESKPVAEAKAAPRAKAVSETRAIAEPSSTPETKPVDEAKAAPAARARRTSSSRRRGPRRSAASKKAAAEAPETAQAALETAETSETPAPQEPQPQEPQETLVPHPEPHETESS